MSDNGNVVSGSATERSAVTDLLLDVGDDGTFWDGSEWENVSDGESGVLSGVDELSSVHALVGDEGLGVHSESVWATECNLCERSSTSWVVDDVLHDTANVTVSLSIVEGSELSWSLVESGVGSWKDRNQSMHFKYSRPFALCLQNLRFSIFDVEELTEDTASSLTLITYDLVYVSLVVYK